MFDRPAHGFACGVARLREEVGRRLVAHRLPGVRVDGLGLKSEHRRLELPGLLQRKLVHIALGRPRHQCRARGKVPVLARRAEAAFRHRRLDLRAPCRERLDHVAGHAGDLKAPVHMGLVDAIAQFPESVGQLRAVDRADRHLVAVEAVVDHGAPLAVAALDHVGDHTVRVELGIEVARGVVPEGRGDHFLAARADHRTRRLVLDPGPDGVLLDPGQRLAHRLVVRVDDPVIAAHHREERDRLRRRQGDVAARAVLELPVRAAATELRAIGNLALEDPAEGVRIDRARESERLRPLAGPAAGLAVCGVVLGVIAIALVVGRALRRGGDDTDRGYHRAVSATVR